MKNKLPFVLLLLLLLLGGASVQAEDVIVFSEDFSANNDINKLKSAGWTFSGNASIQTFSTNNKGLQVASGSGEGLATTPSFSLPSGITATLSFKLKSSSSKEEHTLTVKGNNCKVDNAVSTTKSATISITEITISITEASASSSVTFSGVTGGGCVIDDVVVFYAGGPAVLGAPVFTPVAGAYYYGQRINVTAENATSIKYTSDGSEPDDTSESFPDGGYELKGDVTLKAIAFDDSNTASTVTSAHYTLKAPEVPTFSVAAGSVDKGTTVTLTVGEGGQTVIYTTDGSTPSYANNVGDIYTEPIVINYGQTIRAISVNGAGQESAVAEATYILKVPGSKYYTLVTSTSQLFDGARILIVDTGNGYTMNTTSTENNRKSVEITVSNGRITDLPDNAQVVKLEAVNTKWYLNVGTNQYLYAASSSSNYMKTASKSTVGDNGKASIAISSSGIATIQFNGSYTRKFVRFNRGNNPPLFSCYAKDNNMEDVQIYIEQTEDPTEELTVQSYGWASYIPNYAVEFPSDRAYIVTDVTNNGLITVEAVTKVPARTPVLLKGEGTVTATIIDEVVSAPDNNMLSIGTGSVADGKFPYVLAKDGTSACFKLWTGDESVLKDRVVMLLDQVVSQARPILFFSDGTVTGIETVVTNGRHQALLTDLQGRHITLPGKGLYIVDGKKVLVK